MNHLPHQLLGIAVLPLYLAATIAIGWLTRRRQGDANAFLNASRSLPLPVVVAAYLAANCGALEIVGLSAMAAQYGPQAFHFYWIGAIPALIFLSLWMMPLYRRSNIQSVPEYLELRFGARMRLLNACVVAFTLLIFAGVSLYAMAQVLAAVVGLTFFLSVSLSAGVVLVYVLLGGLRATIYNEVFQLAVMLAGLVPLAWRSTHLLRAPGRPAHAAPARMLHLWHGMPMFSSRSQLDVLGVVLGLGFVLSFGYWCTDFVMMQRAFTARTDLQARQVPLWAGFGKLLFSLIVILPGLATFRVLPVLGTAQRFDQALPALMKLLFGPTMLGLGLTALAASLMSGLAANVSAFAAIWTKDIYRAHLRPHRPEAHYLIVGRLATVTAIAVSILTSLLNFLFSNMMEHVQLIFSIFGSPFWAVFLLGMTTRRATARGAITGFLAGIAVALLHLLAFSLGYLPYGSVMNANFHAALYAFCTTFFVGLLASEPTGDTHAATTPVLQLRLSAGLPNRENWSLWVLSTLLLAICLALNVEWR